jgi:hypothetical protein
MPTTHFDLVPFAIIGATVGRLKKQMCSSYHEFLQHQLYGSEFVGVPPTLCTTPDKMHGIASVVTKAPSDNIACQVKSCFGQILSFRVKLDPQTDTLTHYANVNLYSKHEEAPTGVTGLTSLSMVPDCQSMFQTNILKEFPLVLLYSVGSAHHSSVFTWTPMVGMFNTFEVRYRLDFCSKTLSHVDSSCHVGSPCDLYGNHFSCLSKKTFEKCTQIQERTFKMLNRVSAGQLNTNLVRIDMEPGMWWMLVLHIRKASKLATPSHPVYYSDLKTTSIHHSLERQGANCCSV